MSQHQILRDALLEIVADYENLSSDVDALDNRKKYDTPIFLDSETCPAGMKRYTDNYPDEKYDLVPPIYTPTGRCFPKSIRPNPKSKEDVVRSLHSFTVQVANLLDTARDKVNAPGVPCDKITVGGLCGMKHGCSWDGKSCSAKIKEEGELREAKEGEPGFLSRAASFLGRVTL